MKVGGIILCGGESRRMGRSKAWLPFDGETLLHRTVRVVGEVVEPVVVVAAAGQELPPLPDGVRIVRDSCCGRGPLQGLSDGLSFLANEVDAVYLSSCDVPFLKTQFIGFLIQSLHDNQIAVPNVGGFLHPLSAVYRIDVLPAVNNLLALEQRRVQSLFDQCQTRFISEAELIDRDPGCQSLRNINTLAEYEAAKTL